MITNELEAVATTRTDANARFLELLPQIRRTVRFGLRRAPPHVREEALCECIATAYCAFTRLVERGKAERAYATVLATFALRRFRGGRPVGGRRRSRDVLSDYAQRRHGIAIVSLSETPRENQWEEFLLEDRTAGPAEIAAVRLDFRAWLERLPPTKRSLATRLAAGAGTAEAAHCLGVSCARISQLRGELAASWQQFQTERLATAAA